MEQHVLCTHRPLFSSHRPTVTMRAMKPLPEEVCMSILEYNQDEKCAEYTKKMCLEDILHTGTDRYRQAIRQTGNLHGTTVNLFQQTDCRNQWMMVPPIWIPFLYPLNPAVLWNSDKLRAGRVDGPSAVCFCSSGNTAAVY